MRYLSIFLIILLSMNSINAAEVTVSFKGQIDNIIVHGDFPEQFIDERYQFKVGDAFSGTYTFTTTVPNVYENLDNSIGLYHEPITEATLLLGDDWIATPHEPGNGPFGADRIMISNDVDNSLDDELIVDTYYAATSLLRGPNIFTEGTPYQSLGFLYRMGIYLKDYSHIAIDNHLLTTEVPLLQNFDDREMIIQFGDGQRIWELNGEIDEFKIISIESDVDLVAQFDISYPDYPGETHPESDPFRLGSPIKVNASSSQGEIVKYHWDFGFEVMDVVYDSVESIAEGIAEYYYSRLDPLSQSTLDKYEYDSIITLTVENIQGDKAAISKSVRLRSVCPLGSRINLDLENQSDWVVSEFFAQDPDKNKFEQTCSRREVTYMGETFDSYYFAARTLSSKRWIALCYFGHGRNSLARGFNDAENKYIDMQWINIQPEHIDDDKDMLTDMFSYNYSGNNLTIIHSNGTHIGPEDGVITQQEVVRDGRIKESVGDGFSTLEELILKNKQLEADVNWISRINDNVVGGSAGQCTVTNTQCEGECTFEFTNKIVTDQSTTQPVGSTVTEGSGGGSMTIWSLILGLIVYFSHRFSIMAISLISNSGKYCFYFPNKDRRLLFQNLKK